MTLRHIFVAEATPSFSDATVASKPSARSNGCSAAADGPPRSSGTRIRYGAIAFMTAPSTYRAPPASMRPDALILAPGDAELKSRTNASRLTAGAHDSATATV